MVLTDTGEIQLRAASEWIESVANPLAAGGAWGGVVGGRAVYPRIVYTLASSEPSYFSGSTVLYTEQLWQIEAIDTGSDGTAVDNISQAIYEAFHAKSWISMPRGCDLVDSRWLRPIRRDSQEIGTGTIFRYRGGEYLMHVIKQA